MFLVIFTRKRGEKGKKQTNSSRAKRRFEFGVRADESSDCSIALHFDLSELQLNLHCFSTVFWLHVEFAIYYNYSLFLELTDNSRGTRHQLLYPGLYNSSLQ